MILLFRNNKILFSKVHATTRQSHGHKSILMSSQCDFGGSPRYPEDVRLVAGWKLGIGISGWQGGRRRDGRYNQADVPPLYYDTRYPAYFVA